MNTKIWTPDDKIQYNPISLESLILEDYELVSEDGGTLSRKDFLFFYRDTKPVFLLGSGLKDKNGKEYFENDIIRVRHLKPSRITKGFDEETFIAVVGFSGGRFYAANDDLEICIELGDRPSSHEIIGQKNLNPELLKTN